MINSAGVTELFEKSVREIFYFLECKLGYTLAFEENDSEIFEISYDAVYIIAELNREINISLISGTYSGERKYSVVPAILKVPYQRVDHFLSVHVFSDKMNMKLQSSF